MEHPFMKSIYSKSFTADAYTAHLRSQCHVFSELERLCASRQAQTPLSAVYDEVLHRSVALRSDLCHWAGEDWEQSCVHPSEATAKYLARLGADADDPWLLLCHHFLNYNAVLSGGQFLGSRVSARVHAEPPIGAAFYAFPPECQPTHGRVQKYIGQVDELAISAPLRDRMLECMRAVYTLLLGMFDEVHAMASGDVQASTSASGNDKKLIPAPHASAERQLLLRDLWGHGPVDAAELGIPLLAAVLGRVYDVSAAKDLFGLGAPYEMFSGHDGTYNLAVMSLKKKTLDKFTYEIDDEEKLCLSDWIAYFDHKFGRPVAQLSDQEHSVRLSDLPPASKIPFQEVEDDDVGATATDSAASPPTSKL